MNRHHSDRRRSIASDLPTLAAAPLSGRSIVVKVVDDGAIPTTVPKYFACVPVTPSGTETEGGSRTLTDGTGRIYVCVLGPAVPMAGTYLLASEVGGRWAACYPDQGGGGGGGTISTDCCVNLIPETLFATTTAGTVALTYNGSGWSGVQTVSSVTVAVCSPSSSSCFCGAGFVGFNVWATTTGSTDVTIFLRCHNGAWELQTTTYYNTGYADCSDPSVNIALKPNSCNPTYGGGANTDVVALSGSCSPVSLSGTIPGSFNVTNLQRDVCNSGTTTLSLTNPIAGSITISE